ncbi:MAG: hypothetical protein ACFFBD_06345 [Candidatus Hodarchaeota archaeon]
MAGYWLYSDEQLEVIQSRISSWSIVTSATIVVAILHVAAMIASWLGNNWVMLVYTYLALFLLIGAIIVQIRVQPKEITLLPQILTPEATGDFFPHTIFYLNGQEVHISLINADTEAYKGYYLYKGSQKISLPTNVRTYLTLGTKMITFDFFQNIPAFRDDLPYLTLGSNKITFYTNPFIRFFRVSNLLLVVKDLTFLKS